MFKYANEALFNETLMEMVILNGKWIIMTLFLFFYIKLLKLMVTSIEKEH